jgi:hypothetical protein
MNKYGVAWPDGTPPATIELGAYRMRRDGHHTGLESWEHMYNAAAGLFTPRQYAPHPWVLRRMKAFCTHSWQTWIGPGSTAKSTDAAVCALLHWLSAPDRTTFVVCSTTVTMLEKRIFGELIRFYSLIPGAPGAYRKSETAIVLGDENSKNGIFGVAVLKGTVREALGNMVGLHNTYVGLIIDEMQATRRAAVEAATNLSSSGREFVFLGMGNPESRLDPLGLYSEPADGDWKKLDPDLIEDGWKTKYGWCEFFDGHKCPSITDPHGFDKWPFLLTRKALKQTEDTYGLDSPQYWSQRRGFFPPEGLDRALFSEAFLIHACAFLDAQWASAPVPVAGLDPAFAANGDRCVLRFGMAGSLRVGAGDDAAAHNGICFTDTVVIRLDASEAGSGLPLTYRMAAQIRAECTRRNVIPSCLAMDCTGAQSALADVLESEWGPGILRVQFGGKASDLPANPGTDETGREFYGNRVTELWHVLYRFARAGLIRGLSRDTARELVSRQLTEKLRPVTIEPKTLMKARTGYSPDIADASVVLTALVRERMGYDPDAGRAPVNKSFQKALDMSQVAEDSNSSYEYPVDFDCTEGSYDSECLL